MNQHISAHRFTIVALILGLLSVVTAAGCNLLQSRALSPTDHKTKITRPQLKAEVDSFTANVAAASADLDNQDAVKNEILSVATASIDKFVPAQYGDVLSGLLGAVAIGATADNVRIRRKTSGDPATPQPTDGGATQAPTE